MLPIVQLPITTLRERSTEVTRDFLLSDDAQKFITDMVPAMYFYDGIGLAAPQVGKNIRVCVVGKESAKSLKEDMILVNPVWEKMSTKTNVESEGCLSVPFTFGNVKRYTRILVTAWDRFGNPVSFEAKNFLARVVQHEVDHLDGILFIDKATGTYTLNEKEIRELKKERKDKNAHDNI